MTNRSPDNGGLTALEFFAGGGLAGMGLADFRIAFANDLDPMKAAAWRANHGEGLRLGDVWALTPADLPGRPDLCWASSPCQDVSLAGARGGLNAERSGAFWGFHRLMQGLAAEGRAPGVVVIENVAGLLTSGGGQDFAAVCEALAGDGYRVGALEIDAALWTPQSRPRLFIVAARDEAGLGAGRPSAPFHTARLIAAHDRLPEAVKARWVWWRLSAPALRNMALVDVLEPDGTTAWFDEETTDALVRLAAPGQAARIEAARRSPDLSVAAAYRRVRLENGVKRQRLEARFDGLAGCLRTPAGGSSRQYVLVCGEGRVRARRLTAREAARLMGLPDSYVLPKSESAALKLMGDAVVVPVVGALNDQLLALLARASRRVPLDVSQAAD